MYCLSMRRERLPPKRMMGKMVGKTITGFRSKAQHLASTSNRHFMVLGFTTATGEAVMCDVIVASKKLTPDVAVGFDRTKDIDLVDSLVCSERKQCFVLLLQARMVASQAKC
mmetsp:Transcript_35749/g.54985  ORF Transcript_35749/g.54985 Transcript_35749/m.54985 type:complete len:112 (-) Transcript_35749:119-454(-)